ncbi:MAG: MBL fold metallo-hydrolase [Proteobacteria bacterium]|nr:MBL fold metallo-hydrolase [Pseudomonadota bacterium]
MFLRRIARWGLTAAAALVPPAGLAAAETARGMDGEAEIRRRAAGLELRELVRLKLHHGGPGFINPFVRGEYGNLGRLLKWKLFSRNRFKSEYAGETVRPVSVDWDRVRRHDGLAVTFIKHATIMISDRGRRLLVDPVFQSIFPTIKDFSPLAFDPADMPRPDHVLITHGHRDHLDVDSLASLDPATHVISPLGHDGVFGDLNMNRRTRLDWFEAFREDGREIILAPCNHWSMRGPFDPPNRSLWGSYVVKTASGPTLFISGDVGFLDRYGELGQLYDVDLAVFNLGAYEPRWFMKKHHMNPAEVVRSFRELGAKRLMVVHWGTFRLGDEPVHHPPRDVREEMERHGLLDRLVHLDHGQTLFF